MRKRPCKPVWVTLGEDGHTVASFSATNLTSVVAVDFMAARIDITAIRSLTLDTNTKVADEGR